MRKPSALTVTLLLLVLVPSGVLAWLGLKSADAFEASELASLRSQAEVEGNAWRTRGPELRDAVAERVQQIIDGQTRELGRELPGLAPAQIGARLRAAVGRMQGRGLSIVSYALVDANGRVVYPAQHRARDALVATADMTSAGLLDHLRREADRAYYGPGGVEAAVAVWHKAAKDADGEPLKILFEVEAARLRAREGQAAALAAAVDLDKRWSEEQLVRTGRPAILLWVAATTVGPAGSVAHMSIAGSTGMFKGGHKARPEEVLRDRILRLEQRGVLDATPLTSEERARARDVAAHWRSYAPAWRWAVHAGEGEAAAVPGALCVSADGSTAGRAPDAQERPWSPAALGFSQVARNTLDLYSTLPGGARLRIRMTELSLYKQLMLHLGPFGQGLSPTLSLWLEGYHDGLGFAPRDDALPLDGKAAAFREAAQGVVDIPLPGDVTARMHLTLNRWRRAHEASRERHAWTIAAIVGLLLVTLAGVWLMRRAVLREREARRTRDDFIANVTHEVRTPLTSVLLHSEMLVEGRGDEAKRAEHAAIVQAQGKRLAALVGDMLDFAALERGSRTLESSPVDLGAACREAIAPYRVLAEREGADVRYDEPAEETAAMADPAALARILGNLVGNAWKHGRPSRDGHPGRLRIVAREDARGGVVEVRDDGPGIPAEERARVFERFGRGRGAIRKEGSGIGLSLSRDLAQAMGGDLTVLEEDGETVFRLRLPPIPELDLE